MDGYVPGVRFLLLRLEGEPQSAPLAHPQVDDGIEAGSGEGGHHHDVHHPRVGFAHEQLLDLGSVKDRSC